MGTSTVLLVAVLALVPSSYSQCNVYRALPFFKRSVYEFSAELVSRVAQESENHFITSAFSPWALISSISLGAADQTLEEISVVLRMHPHKCFNNKFFEIVGRLTEPTDGAVLERSATVFVDNRLPLKETFKEKIRKTKVCGLKELPFENFNTVANTINDYVSEATHGNIEEIIEASDLEGVYIVMVDALFFKGTWKRKFSNDETEIAAFYDEAGNQAGDVNLMFAEIDANITTINQIGATVLELPYGNGRYSMLFILPDKLNTISSVLGNLKKISLSSIFTLFGQTGGQTTMVQIPRFKINSDLNNMKEWLTDMGLRSMFDSNLASFPELSDYKLYVSNLIQKATIEVNEEGTEASAASEAGFSGRSLAVTTAQFTANKPFLYMIVDRTLEIPLFTGAYSKPTVY